MAEQKESKGEMTVEEAGRKGGEKTAKTHGKEFYEEIGHKGGEIGGKKGGQRVKELIEEGKEAEEKNESAPDAALFLFYISEFFEHLLSVLYRGRA